MENVMIYIFFDLFVF